MLKDKIIIVTGGSGLIGKAIVKDINENSGIAINADINISTDLINHDIYCDITDRKSINDLVNEVIKMHGKIDGLVNCAYPRTKDWGSAFEDITTQSWRDNVDMQMNSVFNFSQEVLQFMKKQKAGSVVNITSIYGIVGNDFTVYNGTNMTPAAAYSAIKGGIINLTRFLASSFGKDGIRINCVSPGGIFDNQNPTFVSNYENKVPMGRMGNPCDIAPAVTFLLSEKAAYITGHNLVVDGGWTAI
jgi:NAD(P)-dependent dehydrogenase (short-subunit alcohol dehydrogenase family)